MKKILLTFAASLLTVLTGFNTNAQVIRTIAGVNATGYAGDGGIAINASMASVNSIVTDHNGNIYVSDRQNNTIRKVSTNLMITTVAGLPGTAGMAGDGGPAVAALLNNPMGLAIDATGNLYIADNGNNAIRCIDTNGNIHTVAALTGVAIAIDAAHNLLVADGQTSIWKIDNAGNVSTFAGNGTAAYTGDGGAATAAALRIPQGVTTDHSGNVYVADGGNHVIRKINTAGIISTFAGIHIPGYNGDNIAAATAMLNNPAGIHADAAGNIYLADNGNNRIRKIDNNGTITTIVGNGTAGFTGDGLNATVANLTNPNDLNINYKGNIVIADNGNFVIREVVYAQLTTMNMGWATSMCIGTATTFFPITNNDLYNVGYQWTVNGVNTGITTADYTSSALENGDVVRCYIVDPYRGFVLDSEAMTVANVLPEVTPAIYITASTGDLVPAGATDVLFTAVTDNGGLNPLYQWTLDNVAIAGATNATFTAGYLAEGTHINCTLISNANCLTINEVNSNTLVTATGILATLNHMPGGIINIIPNPNNGTFTMKLRTGTDENTAFDYWITDLTGKVICHQTANQNHGAIELNINLDNRIPEGMYQITLEPNGKKITAAFLLAK